MKAFPHALPIACIVVAGAVAISGHDGWGWFLFAAVVLLS